jgi:hypothetical protein
MRRRRLLSWRTLQRAAVSFSSPATFSNLPAKGRQQHDKSFATSAQAES